MFLHDIVASHSQYKGGGCKEHSTGQGIENSRTATMKSIAAVASTSPRIIILRSALGF
jgi:hypothetical protein